MFRETDDFKEYRVIGEDGEERYIQLPLDSEIDPDVFKHLPPRMQYSVSLRFYCQMGHVLGHGIVLGQSKWDKWYSLPFLILYESIIDFDSTERCVVQ